MAVRPIVVWPDKRLRQVAKPAESVTPEIRALYRDMVDTMYADNGLGLAAIQIGNPTNIFIVEAELAGRSAEDLPVPFLNPEVVSCSEETEISDEGCLSFPEIFVPIERPLCVRMRALDLEGNPFEVDAEGLYARCLLHERDHLTGRLLVDFVGPLKKKMIKRRLLRSHPAAAAGSDGA